MTSSNAGVHMYTVGGTVQAGSGLYLARRADDELLGLCESGTFAYVLTSRQMGKSSMIVHTAARLAERDIRSAIIDLSELGVKVTAEEWYLGLLTKLEDQLELEMPAAAWWQSHQSLGIPQRLTSYLREVVLVELGCPVVIFVDEIDTTLSLDFADDFFTAIRSLYNARASDPALGRLSFVLVGVATPGDLIHDPQRTPFNIGQRVELEDFSFEEALPLAAGLSPDVEAGRAALGCALEWTGGHPYLTQRLCQAIADAGVRAPDAVAIDGIVAATFFGERSMQDTNLQFVRDMLTRRAPDVAAVLETYRAVRRRQRVPDEEQSIVKSHLKLSGVVRRSGASLRVRNPIYATVFDGRWVRQHLPVNWARVLRRLGMALLITLFALSLPLAIFAWLQRNQAVAEATAARAAEANARAAVADAVRANLVAGALGTADRLHGAMADNSPVALRAAAEVFLLGEESGNPEVQAPLEAVLREAAYEVADEQIVRVSLGSHESPIQRALWSADGANAFTLDTGGLLIRWDAATGSELNRKADRISDYYTSRGLLPTIWSPDYRHMLVVRNYASLLRIDVSREDQELPLDFPFLARGFTPLVRWSRDSSRMIAYPILANAQSGQLLDAASGSVYVWDTDAATNTPLCALIHERPVTEATIGPDGGRVASTISSDEHVILVWDLPTRGEPCNSQTLRAPRRLIGHEGDVRSLAFSPDGRFLLSASWDKTARIWDVASGAEVMQLRGHTSSLISAGWSPDGARVVSGGDDRLMILWDAATGAQLSAAQRGVAGGAEHAVWGATGQFILITGDSGPDQLWDVQSGALTSLDNARLPSSWSPDGTKIATIKSGGLSIYTPVSGAPPREQPLSVRSASGFEWAPDNRRLLIFDNANIPPTIQIWDSERDERDVDLIAPARPLKLAAWSADGARLALSDADNTLQTWDAKRGTLIEEMPMAGRDTIIWQSSTSSSVQSFPTEARAAVAQGDGTIEFWDLLTLRQLSTISYPALSPNLQSYAYYIDKTFFSISVGGQFDIWNTETGERAVHLAAPPYTYFDNISIGGHHIVLLEEDGSVTMFSLADGSSTRLTVTSSAQEINYLDLSPDGTRLVVALSDQSSLWDVARGVRIATLDQLEMSYSVLWIGAGERLLIANGEGDRELWEAAGGSKIKSFPSVTDVVVSPDGSYLSLRRDLQDATELVIVAADDGREVMRSTYSGGTYPSWSPDGRRLAIPNGDSLELWDIGAASKTSAEIDYTGQSLEWSPDGSLLLSFGDVATVIDGETGAARNILANPPPSYYGTFSWQPGGRLLIFQSWNESGRYVWDSADGDIVLDMGSADDNRGSGNAGLYWSADGRLLLRQQRNGAVQIWDVERQALRASIQDPTGQARRVAIRGDGQAALVTGTNNTVRLISLTPGGPSALLRGHSAPVTALAWSAGGLHAVTADSDGLARVWDAGSGAAVADLKGHASGPVAAALSADGSLAVTGDSGGKVRVWEVGTGRERFAAGEAESPVNAVILSPDGRLAIAGGADGAIRLWDAASGEAIASMGGQASPISALAVSPDGRLLASGSAEGTVQVWDLQQRASRAVLVGHVGGVSSLAFSPDGSRLLSTALVGSALFWDVERGTQLFTLPFDDSEANDSSIETPIAAGWTTDGRSLFAASSRSIQRYTSFAEPDGLLMIAACATPGGLAELNARDKERYVIGSLASARPVRAIQPSREECRQLAGANTAP